jgi:hypothetical protein
MNSPIWTSEDIDEWFGGDFEDAADYMAFERDGQPFDFEDDFDFDVDFDDNGYTPIGFTKEDK